jgi:hypothetical protein
LTSYLGKLHPSLPLPFIIPYGLEREIIRKEKKRHATTKKTCSERNSKQFHDEKGKEQRP